MDRLIVPRLLATGSVVSASTAFRVGADCIALLARRTAPLVRLALEASVSDGGDPSGAALRDELIALLRESAEASWREMRRGVDDFDALTRPGDQVGGVRRAHRVKP